MSAGASSTSTADAAGSSGAKKAETKIFKPLYLSHGGPPVLFATNDGTHRFLKEYGKRIGKPKGIVIVSAHWETKTVEVTSSTKLIYDFYGFGDQYYKFKYSAPEDKPLAEKVVSLLKDSGIESSLDEKRGIDHGTWLPIAIMYPGADVPIVQVALKKGLKFEDQAATGRALAPLIKEGYLLIGSGSSTHNLGVMGELMMFPDHTPEWMQEFEDYLKETLEIEEPHKREKQLFSIMKHKTARQNHPREEHLIPVAFAMAAAGGRGTRVDFSRMMGLMTAAQYEFDIDPSVLNA